LLFIDKDLTMPQHALYTRFMTHPEKGNALISILIKGNSIVSGAKGCRHYIINQDISNDDLIIVNELWDTEEDHAISLALDGSKELIIEAAKLLAEPPEQIILKAVAGKGTTD
jgi:quinol monooxygenase YgiN